MSRHLQYLNCLRAKLTGRYGDDDDAVREVETAIRTLEEVEARHRATFGATFHGAEIGRSLGGSSTGAMTRAPDA